MRCELRLVDLKYEFPKADNFSRQVGAALDDPFAPLIACAARRGRQPRWLVLADDGSDMFAAQRRLQQMWLEPIDNLELLHLAGACEKINERAVKWQGRQVA